MGNIQFSVSPSVNYVYHMLSVAKCGYDNAHGAQYRHLYPQVDLDVLQKYAHLLTVNGGEYCGQLYWYLVSQPACGRVDIRKYYEEFRPNDQIAQFSTEINEICAVMARNYETFLAGPWVEIHDEVLQYAHTLADHFDTASFVKKAEHMLGFSVEQFTFHATLTNSMENGPEAIDISADMDVFSITRSIEECVRFIAHEYIIYLLKAALKDTPAFQSFTTWQIVEALADFYLLRIIGKTMVIPEDHPWIDCYGQMPPETTPKMRYFAAEAAQAASQKVQ